MRPFQIELLSTEAGFLAIKRFWDRVDRSGGPEGCWPWMGAITKSTGYGQATILGRHWNCHTFAYFEAVGPLPDRAHLDHVCHNEDVSCSGGNTCRHRRCCNPRHLVPKTPRANQSNADEPRQRGLFATHCANGHPWAENERWIVRGTRGGGKAGKRERYCAACNRERGR